MNAPEFTWDPRKDAANQRKHGISFAEAESAFLDDDALLLDDPDHSDAEDRFLLIGLSQQLRILVVAHCLSRVGRRDPRDLRPAGIPV